MTPKEERLLYLISLAQRYTRESNEYGYFNQSKQNELAQILEEVTAELKYINKNDPVEILRPELIIAGRVTTRYRGKISSFDVNDLTTIRLSDVKQEGYILTPYQFNVDGTVQRVPIHRRYKIKRIGYKVYWIIDFCDLQKYNDTNI